MNRKVITIMSDIFKYKVVYLALNDEFITVRYTSDDSIPMDVWEGHTRAVQCNPEYLEVLGDEFINNWLEENKDEEEGWLLDNFPHFMQSLAENSI